MECFIYFLSLEKHPLPLINELQSKNFNRELEQKQGRNHSSSQPFASCYYVLYPNHSPFPPTGKIETFLEERGVDTSF